MSFLGILLLSLFTVIIALSLVGRAFEWIAKTPEMTLLGALAWCFIGGVFRYQPGPFSSWPTAVISTWRSVPAWPR